MKKKILSILAFTLPVIIFMFFLTSCNGSSITKYIETKQSEIDNLVNSKFADQYSKDNWALIYEIAENGKKEMGLASMKQEIDRIACETKLSINSIMPQKVDDMRNGAFFIADDSWELYVRNFAKEYDKNEDWIKEVLTDESSSRSNSFRSRSYFWAAVIGDQITISRDNVISSTLSSEDGLFAGKILDSEILLWRLGEDLYVKQAEEIFHFIFDSSYSLSEEPIIQLEKPSNIDYSCNGFGLNFIFLQWNYRSEYGTLGACIEIKQAGEQVFEPIIRTHPYMNVFTVQLDSTRFVTGDNYVRIYHCGGPILQNNKKIALCNNSDYVTFLVRISDDVSIKLL